MGVLSRIPLRDVRALGKVLELRSDSCFGGKAQLSGHIGVDDIGDGGNRHLRAGSTQGRDGRLDLTKSLESASKVATRHLRDVRQRRAVTRKDDGRSERRQQLQQCAYWRSEPSGVAMIDVPRPRTVSPVSTLSAADPVTGSRSSRK